jgi:diaminohydroxyphosphoribosylaminopyrimidine deaminase/5-amino-6-(5-phosphoribosylamino)uracil reductase
LPSPPSPAFRPPIRIILDRSLRLAHHLKTLSLLEKKENSEELQAPVWIFCSHLTAARYSEKVQCLKSAGVKVLEVDTTLEGLCLNEIFKKLWQEGMTSIWVEAGGSLAASLIKASQVDELYWWLSPLVFGDPAALPVSSNGWLDRLTNAHRFQVHSAEIMGPDVLLTLKPTHPPSILTLPSPSLE